MDRFLAQRAFGQRNQKELLLHRSVFQSRYAVQYRLPELLRRNFAAEFGRRIRIESNSILKRTRPKHDYRSGYRLCDRSDQLIATVLRRRLFHPASDTLRRQSRSKLIIPFGGGTQNIQKNELRASERSCGSLDPRHVGFVRRLFAVHDRERCTGTDLATIGRAIRFLSRKCVVLSYWIVSILARPLENSPAVAEKPRRVIPVFIPR